MNNEQEYKPQNYLSIKKSNKLIYLFPNSAVFKTDSELIEERSKENSGSFENVPLGTVRHEMDLIFLWYEIVVHLESTCGLDRSRVDNLT